MISVIEDDLFEVETLDGKRKKVGLKDLLEHAHELSDLCARTLTGRIAVLRLCIAFLEDIFQPEDMDERRGLLREGCFSVEAIEKYIQTCEQDSPRFLLDDDKHPFMQMPFDSQTDYNAIKPVVALFADHASGNAHIHFDHRPIELTSADASEALEGMLETYMFCTAGAQGYPSAVNNTNPVYFLIRGRTLFETLVLNMISSDELPNNIPFGNGMVPWRSNRNIVPKEMTTGISFLEAMTWQPRRLTLKFDEDQRVRTVFMQQGRNFVGDGRWRDPWVPFRRKKDGSDVTVKPELGRNLWRDAGSILATIGNESLAPVTIINATEVWEDIPDGIVPIEAIGMITNQAAILGIVHEMLHIPEVLLEDEDKAGRFREWIALGEEIYGVTTRIIVNDYSAETARLVGEAFLRDVHDVLFGASLNDLVAAANVDAFEAANRGFGDALFNALRDSLRGILEETGTSVENIKRQNAVETKALGYCVKRLKEGNMR